MIRVKTLFALKKLKPTTDMIYVSSVGRLFRCVDGEWIERVNYTTEEISVIVGVSQRQVQNIIRKMKIRPKIINRDRLNFDQVKIIAKAVLIKSETKHKTYAAIRKELNV